ncbi:Protoheme IX farnesyltransferase [bacterium HR33]|nr:Protoheme IX farnesyltransferase [bacterium HR33]
MLAYFQLAKPRITLLVLLTAAAGFYLGSEQPASLELLLHTLIGTALASGGTNAFNQWLEREIDGKMRRTRNRPLPSGSIHPPRAFAFATLISAAGISYLAATVNLITAGLAFLTLLLYVAVYTPLKRTTWLATIAGSIPGALPILGGWTAARGAIDTEAWTLFAILFLWQLPHFWALDWLCRSDYRAAGLRTLGATDPGGRRIGAYCTAISGALLTASLLPGLVGLSRILYLWAAIPLGILLFGGSLSLWANPTERAARRLFAGSVVYLPLLLLVLVAAKRGP